jgi:GNAT superfamily N-acetyltransferase
MTVLVRRAGRRDLGGIHALWRELRRLEGKLDPTLEPPADADRAVREHREVVLADPRSAFFVAEQKGRVLGYLHARVAGNELGYEPARFGVLVELFVHEERRRSGIGRRLLACSREWFDSLGIRELRAELPAENHDARRFLEANGAASAFVTLRAQL